MKFTEEQRKNLSDEKNKIAALSKEQEQIYKKWLKEFKLKDGTTPAQYLWDYLFLKGISTKCFQSMLNKVLKSDNTDNNKIK